MFTSTPQKARRARQQVGNVTPLGIPSKGINARDAFAVMGPEFAINLENVTCETYGIRTRKGYTEWATSIVNALPVSTVMSYYPSTASPSALALLPFARGLVGRMLVEPRSLAGPPAGKLFAASNGLIYDVTAGGPGPWPAQAGVAGPTDFWTWINFQNIAGSFLLACNDSGGYATYNGAAWTMPVAGVGVGQIDGCNPALFAHVMEHQKRLWFIEKDSTSAWYLPVSQITGAVSEFDFGEQFKHGGSLAELESWTVDGGVNGMNDMLVAISTQGDVVVYQGVDPNDPNDWRLAGSWYVGALPRGRRVCVNTGADIHILSQYGVTPLSLLLAAPKELGGLEQRRTSYMISPLIARLMRDYSTLPGWGIWVIPKEELLVIRIPEGVAGFGGNFFVLKILSGAWSVLKDLPYQDFVTIDSMVYAGARNGRVLRAFDGPLDDVKLGQVTGTPIKCTVVPAYQAMGSPAQQKVFKLVRPTFITTQTPLLKLQIMVDYGPPRTIGVPTLPTLVQDKWNEGLWNEARWAGLQDPIHEWLGCHGVGFVGTVHMAYVAGGDTLLASIDFFTEQGGVL